MPTMLQVLHWFSLAFWVGGMGVFSFVMTPAIFKNLPREEAGKVVGILFPGYWVVGYVATGLAFVSYLGLRHFSTEAVVADKARLALLILALVGVGINGLGIGPQTRALKQQIRAATTQEAIAPLQKKFGALHGISMLVNLTIIVAGLAFLVLAAARPIRI
ncbi:MAG: DUF4149 domain-containing protein [Bdellovibrionota bacterium]